MTRVPVPVDRMVPLPALFRHQSDLHGQAHVARVMVHAMRLIAITGQPSYGPQLWAAVFLHDLARTHDGVCHRHGADAARRLRAEPALQQRLAEAGLVEADYPAIEAAVTAHSAPKEVSREHPHWPLIALLKDADGLDRVRLGDLDPRYLRHPESRGMVAFAQALFDATDGVIATGPAHFEALMVVATRLSQRRLSGRRSLGKGVVLWASCAGRERALDVERSRQDGVLLAESTEVSELRGHVSKR